MVSELKDQQKRRAKIQNTYGDLDYAEKGFK